MTKNPIKVEKDTLATKALSIMNEKKITSLCVHKKNNISKTIGTNCVPDEFDFLEIIVNDNN